VRVPIGGKDWAEIRPVEELTRADRIAVNSVIRFEGDAQTGNPIIRASMDDDMATAILARVCTDFPPVKDPSSLDGLTLEQDDALRAAIQPHLDAIKGKGAPTEDNEVPTPSSVS
jgi:hypothetical protein